MNAIPCTKSRGNPCRLTCRAVGTAPAYAIVSRPNRKPGSVLPGRPTSRQLDLTRRFLPSAYSLRRSYARP